MLTKIEADYVALPRVSCSCEKCAESCHGTPGWFLPGEAERAAESLGVTLQAFFDKYLVVEWWGDVRPWAYLLMPRRVNQPNTIATERDGLWFATGTCALLGPDGCRLAADKRPHECAVARTCSPQHTHNPRRGIAKLWRAAKQGKALLKLARGSSRC